jgi:hypothetical protein
MNTRQLCNLCVRSDDSLERMLYDMAHMHSRDIGTLASLGRHQAEGFLREGSRRGGPAEGGAEAVVPGGPQEPLPMRDDLFDELLDELARGGGAGGLIDGYLNDASRHALEERVAHEDMAREYIEEKDVMEALSAFVDARLIDVVDGTYRLTPRACRRLAGHILRRIMESVRAGPSGPNLTGDEGFGTSEGFVTRKYEFGDEFARIDTQATLLAALRAAPAPALSGSRKRTSASARPSSCPAW